TARTSAPPAKCIPSGRTTTQRLSPGSTSTCARADVPRFRSGRRLVRVDSRRSRLRARDPAAVHARGIHREGDLSRAVHGDHAAVSTDVADIPDGGSRGGLHRLTVPGDAIAELACGAGANEIFAGAGGRHGAVAVRRV